MCVFGQRKYSMCVKSIAIFLVHTFIITSVTPVYALTKSTVTERSCLAPNMGISNDLLQLAFSLTSLDVSDSVKPQAKAIYSSMKYMGKSLTVEDAAKLSNLSLAEAKTILDWLALLDREVEVNGQFKGIEKITTKEGKTVYQFLTKDKINVDIFRDYDYRSPTQGSIDFSKKRAFFMMLAWIYMAKEQAKDLDVDNMKAMVARDCRELDADIIEAQLTAIEHAGLQPIYTGIDPNCAATYAWSVRKIDPLLTLINTASHVVAEDVRGGKVAKLGKSGEHESLTTSEIKDKSLQILYKILDDPNRLGILQPKAYERIMDESVDSTYVEMASTVGFVTAGAFKSEDMEMSLYDLAVELEEADDIYEKVKEIRSKVDLNDKPFKGLRICIEGSNTPSGKLTAQVYEELGAEVTLLHGEVKKLSGKHRADPSKIENLFGIKDEKGNIIDPGLIDTMQQGDYHFGLAFDLDGDRGAMVIPVDHEDSITGVGFTVLPPDNLMEALLPFFAERGYNAREGKKVAVVRDVLSTKGVDEQAERLGFELYQTDAGYPFLKARVRALKQEGYVVPMYSERSGHAWSHVTGAFEDPIVISIFFAQMMNEYIKANPQTEFAASEVFEKNTIPYKQSTRFQPLFGEKLLKELSESLENDTGWTVESGERTPTKIVAMGRHRAIKALEKEFIPGKAFVTPAGILTVSDFNTYYDNEAGINRFADIRFTLNGKNAGSIAFRASSNDPTFVCSFETPIWEGETIESRSLQIRYDCVGGVVLDYLEKIGFARVSGEGFTYGNKADAEGTLLRYRNLKEQTAEAVLANPNYQLLDAIPHLSTDLKSEGKEDWEPVIFHGVVNVKSNAQGITDDARRLDNMDDTLTALMSREFTPVLIGHNGSAKKDKKTGKWKDNREELDHVYNYLKERWPGKVVYHKAYRTGEFDASGREILDITRDENGNPIQIVKGKINLLENVRLDKEQGTLDEQIDFANRLMSLAGERKIYVADDFADIGSKGASVEQAPYFANEVYVGPAMVREFNEVRSILEGIDGIVFGSGEKLDDKLPLLKGLLKAIKENGLAIMGSGPSAVLDQDSELYNELKSIAGDKLVLASDYSDSNKFDIGEEALKDYLSKLDSFSAGQVLIVNGTMGFMEHKENGKLSEKYSKGTDKIFNKLKQLARRGVKIVVVGGDAGANAKRYGLDKEENVVIFTGGGVPLKIIVNKLLSGIKALGARQKELNRIKKMPVGQTIQRKTEPNLFIFKVEERIIPEGQDYLKIIEGTMAVFQAI